MKLPEIQRIQVYEGHPAAVYALAPWKNMQFFSADGNGNIAQWTLTNPNGNIVMKIPNAVFYLKSILEEDLLCALSASGEIFLYKILHREYDKIVCDATFLYQCAFVSPYLYISAANGKLYRLHLKRLTLEIIEHFQEGLRALLWWNHYLWIGSQKGTLIAYEPSSQKVVLQIPAHRYSIFSIMALDDTILLTGSKDAHLCLWKWENNKLVLLEKVPAHYYTINAIVVREGFQQFFTASRDKTIRIWKFPPLQLQRVIDYPRRGGHQASVNALLWLHGSLLSAGDDRKIIQWQIEAI